MFCMECGLELCSTSKYCGNCGAKVPTSITDPVTGSGPSSSSSSVEETLSQGAKESLQKLKAKYCFGKKPGKEKTRANEKKELVVHVMDKNKKALKRAFPGTEGLTGCLTINTERGEQAAHWVELLAEKFNGNFQFQLYKMGTDGLEAISHSTTYMELENTKVGKRKPFKIYAMAKGKERQEIVKKFKRQRIQEREDTDELPKIEISKPSPKVDRTKRKASSTVSTMESEDCVVEDWELPDLQVVDMPVAMSKSSPKVDRTKRKASSTVSTMESEDCVDEDWKLPDIQVVDKPVAMSKSSPKVDRTKRKASSTVSTMESEDCVDEDWKLPDLQVVDMPVAMSKSSPKVDRTKSKASSTVSTMESEDCVVEDWELPDLQVVDMPVGMSKSSRKVDKTKSKASSTVSTMESEDIMDKEVEKFFDLMDKKIKRKKMADETETAFPQEGKFITIIYKVHGGMSFSRPFSSDDTLQNIYTFICQVIDPEILPPKFQLECLSPSSCTRPNCTHEYKLEDAHNTVVTHLPPVMVLKEMEYSMNDTLTNYGDVHLRV